VAKVEDLPALFDAGFRSMPLVGLTAFYELDSRQGSLARSVTHGCEDHQTAANSRQHHRRWLGTALRLPTRL